MHPVHQKRLVNHREAETLYSSIKTIISDIPPGVNPFEYFLTEVLKSAEPNFSKAAQISLKGFFAFHVVISATCFLILILPFLRGGRDRRWIFKKLYITDASGERFDSRPLYFINSGMAMALFQLIGSISALIYILLLIQSGNKKNFSMLNKVFTLLGTMYEFEFLTYWAMAWALCTWIYGGTSSAGQKKTNFKRAISPSIFNIIFLAFPALATILICIVIYFVADSSSHEIQSMDELLRALQLLSQTWNTLHTSGNKSDSPKLFEEMMVDALRLDGISKRFLLNGSGLMSTYRMMCAAWAPVMFITSVVFIYSLGHLLVISLKKRQNIHLSSHGTDSDLSPPTPGHLSEEPNPQYQKVNPEQSKKMRLSLYNLAFRGTMAVLAVLSTIVFCMVGAIRTEKMIESKSMKSSMTWFSLMSGASVALPVTLQCWIMYRDKGELTDGSCVQNMDLEEQRESKRTRRRTSYTKYTGTDSESTVLQVPKKKSGLSLSISKPSGKTSVILLKKMSENSKISSQ